jgi:hypothetical protein
MITYFNPDFRDWLERLQLMAMVMLQLMTNDDLAVDDVGT